ncbi:MAG: N-acetylneuraminate synthase family protein [Actinomycetes bacterium]
MTARFVAEVSSNHARDLDRCFSFIDAAAEVGCSGIKFQLFRIGELFAPEILRRSAELRARRAWELPVEFLGPIAERSHLRGLDFLCTPFYLDAVEELLPFVDAYKVASYELLWADLLRACAATGKPVVLSTGMATMDEVGVAVATLRGAGCGDLTLLHYVSDYPASPAECNLAAIATLRDAFGCEVGWSDHSVVAGVVERAVHRWGAAMVEFHLDLDQLGEEYSAGHCWLPDEIAPLIASARAGVEADGAGGKGPVSSESAERDWRADPVDGLRPLRSVRATWRP